MLLSSETRTGGVQYWGLPCKFRRVSLRLGGWGPTGRGPGRLPLRCLDPNRISISAQAAWADAGPARPWPGRWPACCLLGPGARPPAPGRTAGTPQSAGRSMEELPVQARGLGGPGAAEGSCRQPGVEAGAGPPAWGPPPDWSDEEENGAGWPGQAGLFLLVKAAGTRSVAASRARGSPRLHHLGDKNKEGRMITTRRKQAPLGLDTAPAGKVTSFPAPATPLPSLASACSPSTRGLSPRPPGCLG